jgi:hypothetical protein
MPPSPAGLDPSLDPASMAMVAVNPITAAAPTTAALIVSPFS